MDCDELGSSREYSALGTVIGSLPYAVMVLLGGATIALGRGAFWWAWIGAGVYVAYGVLGALWLILFLCPYCRSYGERACPSGYGRISAKLRAKGEPALFGRKFRQHIPVITPLWVIPLVIGGLAVANSFSWALAILLAAFALEAFVALPLLSKAHGCKGCHQREACPWASW